MKTTIFELLRMIKDGKAPNKIIHNNLTFDYVDGGYYNSNYGFLFDNYYVEGILNDEVEILETKITYKPDKIVPLRIFDETEFFDYRLALNQTRRKINEIIDKLSKE